MLQADLSRAKSALANVKHEHEDILRLLRENLREQKSGKRHQGRKQVSEGAAIIKRGPQHAAG